MHKLLINIKGSFENFMMISKTVIMQHHNNAIVKTWIESIENFNNVIILKVNARIIIRLGKWREFRIKFIFCK